MTVRVVFVCTANICRSAFMQSFARAAGAPGGPGGVEFSSAGTHGFDSAPMSEEMAVESAAWGLDVAGFSSRPITPVILTEADVLITAEVRHRQFILDDHPEAFKKVLTLGQAARAAQHLTPGLAPDEVLAELARLRGNALEGDDITDPYLRGAPAQETAARRMSGMLVPLLAALGADRPPSRKTTHG